MERKGYKHTDDDESYEKASGDKDYDGDHDAESKSVTSSGQDDEMDALDKMDDLEVEQEWNAIRHRPSVGRIQKATDPRGKRIAEGLKINFMNMRCGDTGRLLWQSQKWGHDMFEREQKAVVPKSILDCGSVSREINFSSLHEITDFRLEQRVFLHGKCLEEWLFTFGYVIPDSTNSWQQTIEAAETMLPADAISGKITIETGFYDGDALIAKTVYRIFYE
ncbi:Retinal rod rhodopsin-sensitive cGMP 3',5'-cyclic phosphodiesterase subunit delta [Aphanomyces cochlioides]|nr:Retinal rod rhodopsin-sensitive cGMP 3',5'-cyclic phosphodiesterase subunit delta [Aphanomyces cochlioides]